MLTILRGIPGAGKSTYAKTLDDIIASNDSYFEGPEGYKYDKSKMSEAAAACFRKALLALQNGLDVVIDNTNIRLWEYSPYILLADALDVKYKIITVYCPLEVALKRQTHNVPRAVVESMYLALLPIKGETICGICSKEHPYFCECL